MKETGLALFYPPMADGPRWVRDLKEIDRVLREQPELRHELVSEVDNALAESKAPLSAEQWLRVVLIQQAARYDDDDMVFRLNDSRFCRAFCALDTAVEGAIISVNLRRINGTAWSRMEQRLRAHAGQAWRKRYRDRVPK